MWVEVFPSDKGAVAFYRLLEPLRVLREQGHKVTVGQTFGGFPSFRGDVLVFSRPADRRVVESIRMCHAEGRVIVIEADDDLINIPTDNAARPLSDPAGSPDRNWKWLVEAMRLAHLVTVSTPRLVDVYRPHAGHRRFAVLPNCVPASYLDITPEFQNERLQLGWTGTAATHASDLAVVGPALRSVLEEHPDVDFRVVGTGREVQQRLNLPRPVNACGWLPLNIYPRAMACIDVGVVPLQKNGFSQGKSWLKGLEFSSLGVPFVATPTIPYRALHDEGAGLLAERTSDWITQLRRLVRDPILQVELADAGRETAARWTYEDRAGHWWEAWGAAAVNAAGRAA